MTGAISEWLDLMPDEVTFYTRTSRDRQAKAAYSSTVLGPYRCRIELRNRLIVDSRPGYEGREVMARGRVIMGTSFVPSVEDKIVLPAKYVPVSPPMIAVNAQPDENGDHHTTIYIG